MYKLIKTEKTDTFIFLSIERKTQISNHDINIAYELETRELSGDVVRYGSWDDLEPNEIQEILHNIFNDKQYQEFLDNKEELK